MKYKIIDGTIICDIPDKKELDQTEIERIVKHTANTWQKARDTRELRRNTVQGKLAEMALERYLTEHSMARYCSYDRFRTDNLKKHAPFDGIIYSQDINKTTLKACIQEINSEVAEHPAGQISPTLREKLEKNRIFTMEIKSSLLRGRDYRGVSNTEEGRTPRDYETIVQNIRCWDYFVYPHYIRSSSRISSFYEYAESVRADSKNGYSSLGNREFLQKLILTEYRNASDIYTRLYFDYKTNEIFVPGYVIKEAFFCTPKIGRMPGEKSGMALYYMRSIADGASFLEMDKDSRIWGFDGTRTEERLFAAKIQACPQCGRPMQICNVKKRGAYSYKCFDCNSWFSLESTYQN